MSQVKKYDKNHIPSFRPTGGADAGELSRRDYYFFNAGIDSPGRTERLFYKFISQVMLNIIRNITPVNTPLGFYLILKADTVITVWL